MTSESEPAALAELLIYLRSVDYVFVAPTPETHRRVLERKVLSAGNQRDIFGWNRTFAASDLPPEIFARLDEAHLLEETASGWRSRIRAASFGSDLFVHSGFPPPEQRAVFFGPDSYRFARLIRQWLGGERFGSAVDLGAGAGVGAIVLARCAEVGRLHMTDVDSRALSYARVNAKFAGVTATFHQGDLAAIREPIDVVIANPPFIAETGQDYSDGGGALGIGTALEWAKAAAARLSPGGRLLLYSGSPVVGGEVLLQTRLQALAASEGFEVSSEEIDPDIFGEELSRPAYCSVERIAAIGVLMTKR